LQSFLRTHGNARPALRERTLPSARSIVMNQVSPRALRWLAPLLGVTLVSGIASAKVITEVWQVKGIHTPADERKVHDAIAALPSVSNTVVHHDSVRLTFDDQKLQDPAIKTAVAKAGSFELMTRMPNPPKHKAEHAAEHTAAKK
jgi:copper chaperone CopZ